MTNLTKIFIDFDGTLFDRTSFKQKLFGEISHLGLDQNKVLKEYQKARSRFLPEDFIDSLMGAIGEQEMKKFLKALNSEIPQLLFNDTVNFLSTINVLKYEINLLTFGHPKFQKRKVRLTRIRPYFHKVYYVDRAKTAFLKE